MKTIRLIIAGLVMTMGFSSCSSLFYDAKVDVLNSIQKGMSRQEVTKILGTPEYRRFDRDIEEWEYSRVLSGKSNISRTQIVVGESLQWTHSPESHVRCRLFPVK